MRAVDARARAGLARRSAALLQLVERGVAAGVVAKLATCQRAAHQALHRRRPRQASRHVPRGHTQMSRNGTCAILGRQVPPEQPLFVERVSKRRLDDVHVAVCQHVRIGFDHGGHAGGRQTQCQVHVGLGQSELRTQPADELQRRATIECGERTGADQIRQRLRQLGFSLCDQAAATAGAIIQSGRDDARRLFDVEHDRRDRCHTAVAKAGQRRLGPALAHAAAARQQVYEVRPGGG